MSNSHLSAAGHQRVLESMSSNDVDVLVVGEGVTGAGIALDAVTRGLRVDIVEAQDWALGASSRPSKLVHGGLRYLYQLNFALVTESLRERGLLLTETAPHPIKAQPFLWPLKMPVIERMYSVVGVGMYDMIAQFAYRGSVPIQRYHTHRGLLKFTPAPRKDSLTGSIVCCDTRVDDAHLVVMFVRSVVCYDVLAANHVQVTEILKDAAGRVTAAKLPDLETSREYEVSMGAIIDATNVWTEKTQSLAGTTDGLKVLASKGIHIVVPKEKINSKVGILPRIEKLVLFVIPWERYWVIGTTDTVYHGNCRKPVADLEDIDYILGQVNPVLAKPLTHDDIIGTFAGLHPLLQPDMLDSDESKSAQVSCERTVTEAAPGLTAITGDKLISYHQMAGGAVDFTIGRGRAKQTPSVTKKTPLGGAAGYHPVWSRHAAIARENGLSIDHVENLFGRYGSGIGLLFDMIKKHPDPGNELKRAPEYLCVEITSGVSYEGTFHLEDLPARRIRLTYKHADHEFSVIKEVTTLAGGPLRQDEAKGEAELALYRSRYEAEAAAWRITGEAEAQKAREQAKEVTAFLSVAPEIQG